jgi:hypothetical protein
MSRKKTRHRGVPPEPRLENPQAFPLFVVCEQSEQFGAKTKRGRPYFDAAANVGLEVQRVPLGADLELRPRRPWTYVFMHVPIADFRPIIDDRHRHRDPVSFIFDCHFPIMRMDTIIGDDETVLLTLESRAVLLANLGAACAVTVPRREWAADLAEVNPRVWWLPDIDDETTDPDVFEASVGAFALRFAEVAQAAASGCQQTWPVREVCADDGSGGAEGV